MCNAKQSFYESPFIEEEEIDFLSKNKKKNGREKGYDEKSEGRKEGCLYNFTPNLFYSEANKKATNAMYPAWPFASEHQGRMGYCGEG